MKYRLMLAAATLLLLAVSISPASSTPLASASNAVPSCAARAEGEEESAAGAPAQDGICVSYTTETGTMCGSPSSLKWDITNECESTVRAQVWKFDPSINDYREGPYYIIHPGQTASGWWCQAPTYDIKVTYKVLN